MRPVFIPYFIKNKFELSDLSEKICLEIRNSYSRLSDGDILVSVVIPAFNEEKNILKTLSALAYNRCSFPAEILVVNNNSDDLTEALVQDSGVRCITETTQGITAARNAGLLAAKGKYILNADADTIYPLDWIELMATPLIKNDHISSVYGKFAFIPTSGTPRIIYFFYEYFADLMRWINKQFREEAMNSYGFNSGFRKNQGLAVNGFEHPPGTNEDGWLALKLRQKGFGRMHAVQDPKAMVWTTDRRIQMDGGLWQAILKRLRRMIGLSVSERTDL